ncbi:MAG TPA: imidazole glycerol phosphate synthase subunit HisH [Bacteroidales bacterium]|nr:imidazole glycerol phosphate synthase subunit HisH [Bacteroidales bacterium]
MITIIDYRTGNLGSIQNILKRIGESSIVTSDPLVVEKAEKIILPGVGSFDTGMKNLACLNLIEVLNHKVLKDQVPVLGICLGMQLMANKSDEGELPGLGWINASVKKFKFDDSREFKIPHMGWNFVTINKSSLLVTDTSPETRFYFVHSYYVSACEEKDILTSTNYGITFTSAIEKENILGVQFHPEKSHKFGMMVLKNFVNNY